MSIIHMRWPVYDDGSTTSEFIENIGYVYKNQTGEEIPEINWPEGFRSKYSILSGFWVDIEIDTDTGEIELKGISDEQSG